jgi:hypothetical protein
MVKLPARFQSANLEKRSHDAGRVSIGNAEEAAERFSALGEHETKRRKIFFWLS